MSSIIKEIEWRDAKKDGGPSDMYAPILYCTTNNKLGTFKNTVGYHGTVGIYGGDVIAAHSDWKWLSEKYSVKYWTYQSEILP